MSDADNSVNKGSSRGLARLVARILETRQDEWFHDRFGLALGLVSAFGTAAAMEARDVQPGAISVLFMVFMASVAALFVIALVLSLSLRLTRLLVRRGARGDRRGRAYSLLFGPRLGSIIQNARADTYAECALVEGDRLEVARLQLELALVITQSVLVFPFSRLLELARQVLRTK